MTHANRALLRTAEGGRLAPGSRLKLGYVNSRHIVQFNSRAEVLRFIRSRETGAKCQPDGGLGWEFRNPAPRAEPGVVAVGGQFCPLPAAAGPLKLPRRGQAPDGVRRQRNPP